MKKSSILIIIGLSLFIAAGCSNTDEQVSGNLTPAPGKLSVSDLNEILANLELTESTLTYYGETTNTCKANFAIRVESYIEKLQDFTWEEYHIPTEWDGSDGYRCVFTTPGISLTAYQCGYDNECLLRVKTECGDGIFILPFIGDEKSYTTEQVSWMLWDTFEQWYQEAYTAELYNGHAGVSLTADELDWFMEYTASERSTYDEEWDGFICGATPISCFFTSRYSDPRDMDAGAFLYYCPDQGILEAGDEAEFRIVQEKADWRVGEDNHLASLEEMPGPCHRLPRNYINEILTKYAGITVEEMHTDWLKESFYIPETDCFYTFSSDFGPGMFIPRYGEKNGGIVTLWGAPSAESGISDMLVLQKNGENWHILSHQPSTE